MSFIYALQATWTDVNTLYEGISLNVSNGAGGAPIFSSQSRLFRLLNNNTEVFNIGPGNTTAVANSKMAQTCVFEQNTTIKNAQSEGGIWPGLTYAFFTVSKLIDGTYPGTFNSGPGSCLFVYLNNNGYAGDAVGILASVNASAPNTTVFGGNPIVRTESGVTGVKMVGWEIDVEPASGVTPISGSGGLFMNCFNSICGPCIQTGTIGGGQWVNGLIVGNIQFCGVTAGGGSTMLALLHTAGGVTYTLDAIVNANLDAHRFLGTAGSDARMYMSSDNNFRLALGSANFQIRNHVDSVNLVTITSNGTIEASAGLVGQVSYSWGGDIGTGFYQLSSHNIGVATNSALIATFAATGGLIMGAATGGDKGLGSINIAADIYKNNTAYTNPDYVFEKYYTDKIEKFKDNPGASDYKGLATIKELKEYTKNNLRLPGIDNEAMGLFGRGDFVLEKLEELTLYMIELNDRVDTLH